VAQVRRFEGGEKKKRGWDVRERNAGKKTDMLTPLPSGFRSHPMRRKRIKARDDPSDEEEREGEKMRGSRKVQTGNS